MENPEANDDRIEGVGVPVAITEMTAENVAQNDVGKDVPHRCAEALRRIEVFADLPEEQLEWFIGNAEERNLETGDILFRKGDAPDWMIVYLEGEVHARRGENDLDNYVYISRAGDAATEVAGKLPFSRMKTFPATAQAVTKTRLLLFPVRLFPELIRRMPVLAERLVWIMNDRVRETTAQDQTRDKLIALGKLSAGLAHELNNPAAAASRTAGELLEMLEELRTSDLNLCRHDLTPEQRALLADFESKAIADCEQSNNTTQANALEMSDHEDAMLTWLETNKVEKDWRIAPVLVEAGIDTQKLDNLTGKIGGAAIADVLARLGAQLTVAKLASEIKTSVTRISDLVGAIKEYSYMDRTAVGEIDLHRGLDNTLLILKYKLKKKNITVVREYGENLPLVRAHGSELNLVWTNLIANAIDAMTDGGQLKIRTRLEPSDVFIEIRDNGSGIPPEIQSRIFEPFFTTKGVNEGTGLGLDTVSRIVRHHHGNLRFESKPGDTCFQIRLPLKPEDAPANSSSDARGSEESGNGN